MDNPQSKASIPKAIIKVGYACNNNCVFCHSAPHRGLELDTPDLLEKIDRAALAGAEMVVLSGGEPTIRPDLEKIAQAVAERGLGLGLVTNGRMLAYRRLADALLKRGLDYVYLSLCGPDPTLHDRHVRAEAFDQFLRSVGYLNGKVTDLTVNVVVTRWNLEHLHKVAGLLDDHGFTDCRLKFSCLEPEGNVLERFDELVPDLAASARAACSAAEQIQSERSDRAVALDGYPLCLMPALAHLDAGLRTDGIFAMAEAWETDLHPVDDDNRSFGRVCVDCSLRRRCRGVFTTYLQRRGEAELAPVRRPVPNAFDLAPDPAAEPDEALDLRSCPIRAGRRPPPDSTRGLLLRTDPGRARRVTADTLDFSDRTVRSVLRERGQVYLDRGADPAVTDFPAQLIKLELARACRRCPRRPLCGGLHRKAKGQAFAAEIQRLNEWLAGLRGRVLDVGCGTGPYRDALRPALAKGELTYLGLDPAAQAGKPEQGVAIRATAFEDFTWDGPAFDAVLALRSLNHLTSPAQALQSMTGLMAPGGRLLLVEDVVFATVRPPEVLARIRRRRDLAFEHLYNLELEEVLALAGDLGLEPLETRSPDQTGCTLFSVVLRR